MSLSSNFKIKKPITNENKIKQIKAWNDSDISKQPIKYRPKKVHFDTTTRFLDACINFYEDEINNLLESGVDVNCADKDNLTAMHQACINSRIDLVDFLLKKNANINVCDKEGWTPLHIAADIGSFELAKFLIDHGARLDVANYDGDLPITFVNESDYPDLRNFFLKEMDKRKINSEECSNHERKMMLVDIKKWKLNGKYSPPIDKINKSTPIHVAASKNYVEILSELLPLINEDDINAQDIDGWTALHAAAHWGHREACKILINSGADLDIRTRANESILDTVDPEIEDLLREDIRVAQMEKERTKTQFIRNDILVRADNSNKRRSSIVRQSVEWKKNAQMKDPASERETLSKAVLNSDSSGIITIEECEEKMSPIDNITDVNLESSISNDEISSESSSLIDKREENDSKASTTSLESMGIEKVDYYHPISEQSSETNLSADQYLKDAQLSNGDNCKNDKTLLFIDSNNGALINDLEKVTYSDSEEMRSSQDNLVKLRPKSIRDAIMSHRSTIENRLSLVMAPAKSDEAEVMRREKARRVRSTRRSTQAIDLMGFKEIEKQRIPSSIAEIKNDESDNSKLLNIPLVKEQKNRLSTEDKTQKRENDDSEIQNINKIELQNQNDFSKRATFDVTDSSSANNRRNLRYQISCPAGQKSRSANLDRARLNISNKLNAFITMKAVDTQDATDNNTVTTPGRGVNVNKCIESNDFHLINESSNETIEKNQDIQPMQITNNLKEKNSGSFVAKPILGTSKNRNLNKVNDNTKSQLSSISLKKDDFTVTEADTNDLKNQISNSILTRMLNDQTEKQLLQKEIETLKEEVASLKEQLKNLNEETHYSYKDLSIPYRGVIEENKMNFNVTDQELIRIREENKKLKSQNEALLRVISRIQRELESLRKLPTD